MMVSDFEIESQLTVYFTIQLRGKCPGAMAILLAMPAPRRGVNSRRSFLKTLPTVIAGTATAPALLRAQHAAAPRPITADDLAVAQQIVGVHLPDSERESARVIVARNRDNIEQLRRVPLASETEPAFSFRPAIKAGNRAAGAAPTATARASRAAAPTSATARRASARPSRPASLDALAFEPITTLASLIRSRQISSTELTRLYLDRLKRYDPTLFCVVTLLEERALAEAAEADRDIRAGRYRGPLHGVPYGIKDLFAVNGVRTTWGAKPYAAQVFNYDATVVTRLRQAGAVLVAKLATGELAIGDLWFAGRTRNPWNPERGSGGSSAGPAAATAAGLVGFAIGTETGGSIVGPASNCGVVGLRPTYGRVSRYGCMTLRWTLDKVGPMARSVADAALVLEALHGPDGRDETVADLPFSWNGERTVKGLRIGYIAREFEAAGDDASPEDRAQFAARKPVLDEALDFYRRSGATLVPLALPDLPAGAIYALLNAEAGAMFDELLRSGSVNELADKGSNGRANQLRATRFISAVDYIRAQRVRTLLMQQMNALLESVDVFLAPSSSESVTVTNLTGHPAVVLPAGFAGNMPVALMVTGRLWGEDGVLRVAAAFEGATEHHTRHPSL
jgi:Asp-tRNA(Asn)/Glu-tRNA(Gln) amidotransferase A subunit family amidase